jgi:hypothetical protein
MVFKYVANETDAPVRGMWFTSSTLLSDVHIAYRVQRSVPSIEESSREFHAVLSELSFLLGVFREEEDDEDIFESDGDC